MAIKVTQDRPPLLSGTSYAQPTSTISAAQPRPPAISLTNPAGVANPFATGGILGGLGSLNLSPTVAPPAATTPGVIRPPKLDLAAVQAKARKQAEGAVNPYYTKVLNDFLAQQAAQRQQQQTIYDTGVKNLEEQLAQTLETNKITGNRTTEDVAQNQADINQTADVFQTDTGQAADAARIAQARELAQGGLTGGLGAQQVAGSQKQRNTAEKRQEQEFQKNRNEQELFKTRTFEDLARSGEVATKNTAKGKKAAKFDLDSFIQNQGFETKAKKTSLEAQRLEAIQAEQQNRARLAFNTYLANIRDPAQLVAASQTYGGAF